MVWRDAQDHALSTHLYSTLLRVLGNSEGKAGPLAWRPVALSGRLCALYNTFKQSVHLSSLAWLLELSIRHQQLCRYVALLHRTV